MRFTKNMKLTDVVMEKGFQRHAIATQQLQRVVGVFLLISYYYGFDKVEEVAPTSVKKLVLVMVKQVKRN
jgi:hypothetical protein